MGKRAHVSLKCSRRPAWLMALGLALLGVGCFAHSGPSHVAQGRYFAAGVPAYDEFFLAVHRLQLEMAAAPAELDAARRTLAEAVVSVPDAPSALLAEKVKVALDELAERGLRARIEFRIPVPADPQHTMVLLTPWANPSVGDRQGFERIEAGMTRVVRFGAAMRFAAGKLSELRGAAPRLQAGVDTVFRERGSRRRSEVAVNVGDAERVLVLMLARADELGKPADELVTELNRALASHLKAGSDEPPSEPPSETPPPPPEPPPPPRARVRAAPARPAEPGKAKQEPPKSADFEP